MPGLDLSSKLRRALGQGRIVPREVIGKMMEAFDRDQDGGLSREEFATFLKKHRVGGPWFCDMIAQTLWNFCTSWYSKDVTWIRIDALAFMVHSAMHERQRPHKRYRITPEGAMGYVPLEPMDGSAPEPAITPQPGSGPLPGAARPAPNPPPRGASAGPPPRRGPPPGGHGSPPPRRGPAPSASPSGSPRRGPPPGPRPSGRPGPRRPGPRK